MSPVPSSERVMRAQLAAYRSWANTPDFAARTAPARAKFDERFEREVDPGNRLDPIERARRADYARKAYFAALALKSARSRRLSRSRRVSAVQTEPMTVRGDEVA